MIARISDTSRFELLNTLETEIHFCRDLLHMIADDLNDLSYDDLSGENKRLAQLATTLAIVARDRIDDTYRQMNAINEEVSV